MKTTVGSRHQKQRPLTAMAPVRDHAQQFRRLRMRSRKAMGILSGQDFVEQCSEGVDVAPGCDRFAAHLFGRGIGGSQPLMFDHCHLERVVARREQLRDSEVQQLRFAVFGQRECSPVSGPDERSGSGGRIGPPRKSSGKDGAAHRCSARSLGRIPSVVFPRRIP